MSRRHAICDWRVNMSRRHVVEFCVISKADACTPMAKAIVLREQV